MNAYQDDSIDDLIAKARAGHMDAAVEAVERVKQARYLLTSSDRAARHFRLGVMPADVDKLRATTDRATARLRELFRHHREYKIAGLKI